MVKVAAGAGIVNTSATQGALEMMGSSIKLLNDGIIDATNLTDATNPIIMLNAPASSEGFISNAASGRIGHEGAPMEVVAIRSTGPGQTSLQNDGVIYGLVDFSGSQAIIDNGFIVGSSTQTSGRRLIDGAIITGATADQIRNSGTITGAIATGDGNDTLANFPGGIIGGTVDMGAGADIFTQEGDETELSGDLIMGAGEDVVQFGGFIRGNVSLGDDNDVLGIYSGAELAIDRKIDGGAGHDEITFNGNTGRWSASRFTNIEGLVKDGGGTTVLAGAWSLGDDATSLFVKSGTIEIEAGAELSTGAEVEERGTLLINGTIHGNVSNYREGGLIAGAGAIGTATAFAAGTNASLINHAFVAPGGLAAGTEIGTLTVFGNYTQTATGRLDIHLGAPGTSDLLDVKGTATLTGAVNFIPLSLADAGSYTFLNYTSRTGEFSTVQENGTATAAGANGASVGLLFSYEVDYLADKATVSIVKTGSGEPGNGGGDPGNGGGDPGNGGGDPGDDGETPPPILEVIANLTDNQNAVRNAFLSDDVFSLDLASVRASLNGIDAGRAAQALDSYSGETYGVLPFILGRAGSEFAGTVANRLRGERSGQSVGLTEVRPEGSAHGTAFWTQALISAGDQQDTLGTSRYDYDVAGLALGIDRAFGPIRAGIAGGYSKTDVDQPRLGATAEVNSIHGGLYATADFGAAFVDAQASYSRHDIDVRRTLITGNRSNRFAEGETKADEFRSSIKGGYTIEVGDDVVRPYVMLGYASVRQDALREQGAGDAGLLVAKSEYEAFTGTAGIDATWNLGSVRPYANLAVAHDLHRDGWAVRSEMIGGGGSFLVRGASPGRTAGLGSIGFTGALGVVELNAGYNVEVRDTFAAHAVTGGVKVRW